MKKLLNAASVVILLAAGAWSPAQAQRAERSMTASISGRGGDGKCTIEVNVDDTAVVEIRGDRARLITLAGQPAEFRRFQCNQRMPLFPNEFRFSGVDGRGRQQLLNDPATNRGTAAIRIEDPQGGREGYTFDIEWRGGSDNETGRMGSRDRDGYRGGDGYRGDRRDATYVVSCSSDDGGRRYCDADTRGGVRLVRQVSGSPCREGSTWGYDRRGIWVDRGCRAEFEVRR